MTTSPNVEQASSDDGTQRLDVEMVRSQISALAATLELAARSVVILKSDLTRLLDELDGVPPEEKTEPHFQVQHEV